MLFSLGMHEMADAIPPARPHVPSLSRRCKWGACMEQAAVADGNSIQRPKCAAAVQAHPSQCQALHNQLPPLPAASLFPQCHASRGGTAGVGKAGSFCTLVWSPAHSYPATKGQQACTTEQESDSLPEPRSGAEGSGSQPLPPLEIVKQLLWHLTRNT